jgi:hypothetical protein
LIEQGETAKIRPEANSRWFGQTAAGILAHVSEAKKRIAGGTNKEFESTMVDLSIAAHLARFHSARSLAAVSYRLFDRTKAPGSLDDAIRFERGAVNAWRDLVAAAGDFYAPDLMMGVRGANLCGHWRDELSALEKGLGALEEKRKQFPFDFQEKPGVRVDPALGSNDQRAVVEHSPVTNAPLAKPLTITATVRDPDDVKWVRLRYRSVNQHQDYRTLPMTTTGKEDQYAATIPPEHIAPAWDLMYFIEVMDNRGHGLIHPDLDKETPYLIVSLQR